MLRNLVKSAVRNLSKRKGYAAINVAGLGVGMACCMLILLYVQHELSFGDGFAHGDRIVRVETDWDGSLFATTPMRLAPALQSAYPEVEEATRLYPKGFLFQKDEVKRQERQVYLADSTFFDVFSYALLRGDPSRALTAPFSIVLSETAARRYFGDADPLGQTLLLDHQYTFTVTGVVAPMDTPHQLAFDALISMSTGEGLFPQGLLDDWFWTESYTYLLLDRPEAAETLRGRLPDFYQRNVAAQAEATGQRYAFRLAALPDLYLHADAAHAPGPTGSLPNLYLFSAIAVFILLLATINYVNLATARAAERAREVGVRKSLGALRSQVAIHFLGESIMLAAIGGFAGLLMAELTMPAFERFAGVTFGRSPVQQPLLLLATLATVMLVGVLAGSFPAFVLSRFRPARVLRGMPAAVGGTRWLRRGLVVFQFTIATALLVGTIVVVVQQHYLRHRDLGFHEHAMLVVNFDGDATVQRDYEAIEQAFLDRPDVEAVSLSSDVPSTNQFSARTEYEDPKGEMEVGFARLYFVDPAFLHTYGIKLVAGRMLSKDRPTDATSAMMVNETAARRFGYGDPADIIGKQYQQWGATGTIVGVFADFNYLSLHERVAPLSMRVDPSQTRFFTVRLTTDDLPATLDALAETWGRMVPNRPFDFSFLDQRLDSQYRAELRFGRVFGVFAALAMFIACLGLFGLASYTVAQRTKEIGVRKALGASASGIAMLLSRETVRLVLLGFALAVPIAYAGMRWWLQDFAYRIDVPAWTFLLAGATTLVVAALTVSVKTLKAARGNPVEALRYE